MLHQAIPKYKAGWWWWGIQTLNCYFLSNLLKCPVNWDLKGGLFRPVWTVITDRVTNKMHCS